MCATRTSGGWTISVLGAGLVLAFSVGVLGGDLEPPPGPVGPTTKTLNEVEPRIAVNDENTPGDADSVYRIAVSGSYYLTDDVVGPSGFHGIEVAADGVTLDLNGFEVRGNAGSKDGILFSASADRGAVRDGSLQLWGGRGVVMLGTGCVVEGIRVEGCTTGIKIGQGGLVSRCSVMEADEGFDSGAGSSVIDCMASDCAGNGFSVGFGAVVSRCTSYGNAGVGIQCSWQATITGCAARDNGDNGFSVGFGCLLSDCTSRGNGEDGFSIGNGSVLVDSSAYDSGDLGIDAGTDAMIRGCVVSLTATYGIDAEERSVIESCRVSNTGSTGINVNTDCVVRGCAVSESASRGITMHGRCLIEGNLFTRNGLGSPVGYSAVAAYGGDNVIKENVVVRNDLGIYSAEPSDVLIDNVEQNNP